MYWRGNPLQYRKAGSEKTVKGEIMQNTVHIETLISDLPCQYQNIYGHPEYDETVLGIDTIKNGEKIADIINQYKKLTGKTTIKVLDIGCAQGYYSLKAAELGCKVVGIDLEEKNIAICKYLNRENKFSVDFRKEFLDYDFVKNIQDDEYDFIFLFNVIHHVACGKCYGYKTNGLRYAKKIMNQLSHKTKILIASFAVRRELYEFAKQLPDNYRCWVKDFKFYNELRYQYIPNKLQRIYRPVVFASNYYSFDKDTLYRGIYENFISDYLIFKCGEKSKIFKKEILTKYSELVQNHIRTSQNDIDYINIPFEKYNLYKNQIEYKYLKPNLKTNILGITFALRAGRIVRTIFKEKKNQLYFIREIIGTKDKINNMHYALTLKDNKRQYIDNAVNEADILMALMDDEVEFLKELELYIAEAFRIFRWKDNYLKPEAYDIAPINCVKTKENSYFFFDFEFELVDGVEKSYALYKCLHWLLVFINKKEKLNEYYIYFADKFNIENKLNWCEYFDKNYASFVSPMYKGKHWNQYNNCLKVKICKYLSKLFTCMIFPSTTRTKMRNKIVRYICYPNYRIAKRCGLTDIKDIERGL